MLKLYIIVRSDIGHGLMIPQACHAQDAFLEAHPELYAEWRTKYKNLIVKELPNEAQLQAFLDKLQTAGVPCVGYREEDLDHALTAIAFYGTSAKRFAGALPLALQPPKAPVANAA